MADGKVKEDAKNDAIERKGVDDAAREAHALRVLQDSGEPSARKIYIYRCIQLARHTCRIRATHACAQCTTRAHAEALVAFRAPRC